MCTSKGFVERSCDRFVQLSQYLSSDVLSRLYVTSGPAASISNKYYYSNDTYYLIDTKDQGMFLCFTMIYILNKYIATTSTVRMTITTTTATTTFSDTEGNRRPGEK